MMLDATKLLIFICGMDGKFSLYEELVSISSLHGSTTGEYLLMKVNETLS
jgi:hypothetical protein